MLLQSRHPTQPNTVRSSLRRSEVPIKNSQDISSTPCLFTPESEKKRFKLAPFVENRSALGTSFLCHITHACIFSESIDTLWSLWSRWYLNWSGFGFTILFKNRNKGEWRTLCLLLSMVRVNGNYNLASVTKVFIMMLLLWTTDLMCMSLIEKHGNTSSCIKAIGNSELNFYKLAQWGTVVKSHWNQISKYKMIVWINRAAVLWLFEK